MSQQHNDAPGARWSPRWPRLGDRFEGVSASRLSNGFSPRQVHHDAEPCIFAPEFCWFASFALARFLPARVGRSEIQVCEKFALSSFSQMSPLFAVNELTSQIDGRLICKWMKDLVCKETAIQGRWGSEKENLAANELKRVKLSEEKKLAFWRVSPLRQRGWRWKDDRNASLWWRFHPSQLLWYQIITRLPCANCHRRTKQEGLWFWKGCQSFAGKKSRKLVQQCSNKKAKGNARMEGDARETRTDYWLNENTTFKLL